MRGKDNSLYVLDGKKLLFIFINNYLYYNFDEYEYRRRCKMLKALITSMRPKQWYKNLILFVGIVFSMNLLNFQMWQNVIAAFAIFCMLSGSEYIINDIIDIEKDRKHPTKRKRPIASGKLKKSHALLFAVVMIICAGGRT